MAFDAGAIRNSPLPSAQEDASGKVYVVWNDCRFRASCQSNDIVMSTSTNGTTWTPVVRIPIGSVTGDADHMIPGIGIQPGTSGPKAKIASGRAYALFAIGLPAAGHEGFNEPMALVRHGEPITGGPNAVSGSQSAGHARVTGPTATGPATRF